MKNSRERILTTHAGSLPRPADLLEMVQARADGRPYDQAAHAARVRSAVADIVRKQAEVGLDVVTDGEMSKPSFITYVTERLTGFEPSGEPGGLPWGGSKEVLAFPEFYEPSLRQSPNAAARRFACTGPITYRGQAQLQADIDNLRAALAGVTVAEAFIPAIAPSNVEGRQPNKYYKTDEEYLFAIADAMREEYRLIVDAGFLLQIDDPRLVTYYIMDPRSSVEQCRRWAAARVEALNHALRDIPRERVRFHTCYSIDVGPRVHDMALKDIVDVLFRIKAGAFSFEAANPRHEHEYHVFEQFKPPAGMVLIPGVISHTTNLVEHPELIAERIVRFARIVGRDNVIAGADCGFAASGIRFNDTHPSVAWLKFAALAEGARLATRQLWGRG